MEAVSKEIRRKLAEANLNEIEQMHEMSQSSEDLLDEVSWTNLDDETKEQSSWVNRLPSECDQLLTGGASEAEEETSALVTKSDDLSQFLSTSNELVTLQTQPETRLPHFSFAAPTQLYLNTAAPVFVVSSRSSSTLPSKPTAI